MCGPGIIMVMIIRIRGAYYLGPTLKCGPGALAPRHTDASQIKTLFNYGDHVIGLVIIS